MQFDALASEGLQRWELVGGERVELFSGTPQHQEIAFMVLSALRVYLASRAVHGLAFYGVEFA